MNDSADTAVSAAPNNGRPDGYIRCLPEPEREGPGRRPSPAYLVHQPVNLYTTVVMAPGSRKSGAYALVNGLRRLCQFCPAQARKASDR
jgi:hypothetical protein